MLATHGLSFSFPSRDAVNMNFPDIQCATGAQWLLLGQSGSGKTTLLHLLAGLRTPAAGTVTINDTIINRLSTRELDRFRGQQIGIVFQQAHFVRALTVAQNLALARQLAGLAPDPQAIRGLLERLNVGHKLHALPQALSVGEQQRVAIARALINEPTVILADEPTSALDDHNTEQVVELLQSQAAAANATLLVVTHDQRLKANFDQYIQL
jgi:ABC-type lipoprotein export system ATPase subunit